ncbi:glutaredoxin-C4-like [Chrysoperla carnea]|uniref:glutaredoxin-C4-like n=1 Tax=Chrysoperla carnea TaxID=189513 RepID=UPI001D069194|nr:glutaredoxin-C4-like [Chrysoperla carnea]
MTESSVSKSTPDPSTITIDNVNDIIRSDRVVIFSKAKCPYCTMAKEVFDNLKQTYTVIELDERKDIEEIKNLLGEITGATTVPRVFINGIFVGGGSDVKTMYENGELQKRLNVE